MPRIEEFTGVACSIAEVERELARLRDASTREGEAPNMRTSVMTHLAWAPAPWTERAEETLAGLAERHPSRTILLVPDADAGEDRIDAKVSTRCYQLEGVDRAVCSEIVLLHLHGKRAKAPASIVQPLLVSDLPVFCRWRGEPAWGSPELDQLVALADRLVVDSGEWDDLPYAYTHLAGLFERTAVSDIAWGRSLGWRLRLADRWPGIAGLRQLRVAGPVADALLLAGWLRSRLDAQVELVHEEADELELVAVDGEPLRAPRGDRLSPSELLSAELDRFGRDRIYEAAVRAA